MISLVPLFQNCSGGGGGGSAGAGGGPVVYPPVSGWSWADNFSTGIGLSPTSPISDNKIAAHDGKLFALWGEANSSNIYQLRVAYRDGNGNWISLSPSPVAGLNKNSAKHASRTQLISVAGKLYAIWLEYNASNIQQFRAKVFNNDYAHPSWTAIDGDGANGLNKNVSFSVLYLGATAFNGKLYVTTGEQSATGFQARVLVYNPTTGIWSYVDGNGATGLNRDTSRSAGYESLVVFNSKLYLFWSEVDVGSPSALQLRAKVYNGDDSFPTWSFIAGSGAAGLNFDSSQSSVGAVIGAQLNNQLYLAWTENDSSSVAQIRVAKYNGDDSAPAFAFVDGGAAHGLNLDATKNASNPFFATFQSRLYLSWQETNGITYTIKTSYFNGEPSAPVWNIAVQDIDSGVSQHKTIPQMVELDNHLYISFSELSGGPGSYHRVFVDSAKN